MKELEGKRPATVLATLPRQEILTAGLHQKGELMTQLHKMARRGEIGATYDLRQIPGGWAVKVIRIAEQPSWWSRNGLRASLWAVGGLGFLGAMAYVLRLLALALAAFLPLLAGAALLIGGAALLISLTGSGSVNVTQIVKVKR